MNFLEFFLKKWKARRLAGKGVPMPGRWPGMLWRMLRQYFLKSEMAYGRGYVVRTSLSDRVDSAKLGVKVIALCRRRWSRRRLAKQLEIARQYGIADFYFFDPRDKHLFEPVKTTGEAGTLGLSQYAQRLRQACQTALARPADQRLVFVDSWDALDSQNALAPDSVHGFAYLHATANVLRAYHVDAQADQFVRESNLQFKKKSDTAIVFHCHFEDLFEPMAKSFLSHAQGADLFLSLRRDSNLDFLKEAKKFFPNIYFIPVENRGRDIKPFLLALEILKGFGYSYGCKIHSKKSLHMKKGGEWRNSLLGPLLGGEAAVQRARQAFDANSKAGLLAPLGSLLPCEAVDIFAINQAWLDPLLGQIGRRDLIGNYAFRFPAGSMFWFRLQALSGLGQAVLAVGDFADELGQVDATLAHAVERFMPVLVATNGYQVLEIDLR